MQLQIIYRIPLLDRRTLLDEFFVATATVLWSGGEPVSCYEASFLWLWVGCVVVVGLLAEFLVSDFCVASPSKITTTQADAPWRPYLLISCLLSGVGRR